MTVGSEQGSHADTVTFTPQTLPIKVRERGVRPQMVAVSPTPPQRLANFSEKGITPLFAEVEVGAHEQKVKIAVIADTRNSQLSFQPSVPATKTEFKADRYRDRNGTEYVKLWGQVTIPVRTTQGNYEYTVTFERPDPRDPNNAATKDALYYTSSTIMRGSITLGGKTYAAALHDTTVTGDFRGTEGVTSNVLLLIDRNGNGVFDKRGESYDTALPFKIDGATYEVKNIAPSGSTFEIVTSEKTVPEFPAPPDLRVGKPAVPFTVKTLDGKTVSFPKDYKGKKVLLYFWASWCGDCKRELPNLLKAYKEFHGKGIEILGISLDRPNGLADLKAYLKANGMTWAQSYDGKMWETNAAFQYLLGEIPGAYLVDSTTGTILASGDDLLGSRLPQTLTRHTITRH